MALTGSKSKTPLVFSEAAGQKKECTLFTFRSNHWCSNIPGVWQDAYLASPSWCTENGLRSPHYTMSLFKGVTWWGRCKGANAPQYLFYVRISILATELKRVNKKNRGDNGGKECIYIKDWFEQIFPLFLT